MIPFLTYTNQQKFKHWLDFLIAMTEKEIKARYKHAVLGFLWVVLNPLLQMLVMGFIFQFFVPVKVDNYFLFLFTGLLPWNLFSMSVSKVTPMFVYERSLIAKAKFPRETIVLSIILSNLFHFLVALCLLLPILLFFYSINWAAFVFLLPALIVYLLLFTSSLSLLTASLNVKFRDISFFIQALMPLWFYATPIVYSLDLIPRNIRPLLYLNPMTSIIQMFHYVFLKTSLPDFRYAIVGFVISIIIFALGIKVFKKESKYFDDWM